MAGYWLKLYTEILDDPKYYRLSDNAKLGMYELMLVAKKVGNDGDLPTLDDICFYTRRDESWWTPVIAELKRISFITLDEDGGDIIRKFEERQAALPNDEKQRRWREAQHKKDFSCYEPVTEALPKVTESKSKSKSKSRVRDRVEVDADNDSDIITFCEITQLPIPAIKAIRDAWAEQLTELRARGVTENIIRRACKELTEKGTYRITSPKSIIKACDVVLAEKKRKSADGYVPMSSNPEFAGVVNR